MTRAKIQGGKASASGPHVQVVLEFVSETRTGNVRGELRGEFIGQRFLDMFVDRMEQQGIRVTVKENTHV